MQHPPRSREGAHRAWPGMTQTYSRSVDVGLGAVLPWHKAKATEMPRVKTQVVDLQMGSFHLYKGLLCQT